MARAATPAPAEALRKVRAAHDDVVRAKADYDRAQGNYRKWVLWAHEKGGLSKAAIAREVTTSEVRVRQIIARATAERGK